jgi:hypothetical protein
VFTTNTIALKGEVNGREFTSVQGTDNSGNTMSLTINGSVIAGKTYLSNATVIENKSNYSVNHRKLKLLQVKRFKIADKLVYKKLQCPILRKLKASGQNFHVAERSCRLLFGKMSALYVLSAPGGCGNCVFRLLPVSFAGYQ